MTLLDIPSPSLTRSLVRITAGQYHEMIEKRIIPEDSTMELLDGMIVYKDRSDSPENPMGHGPKHRLALRLLTKLAARIDSNQRHLQLQLPIQLSEFDEPEPDGAVILGSDEQFADHLPQATDVASVIEVAQSSLERDSRDKLLKYVRADIRQYVIINLREKQIECHEVPAGDTYRTRLTLQRGDILRLQLGHGELLEVAVTDLLP